MMKWILLMSIMTPMMNHPLTLGLMIILQTTMMSMLLSFNSKSSWFAYILFITMIGGMMIMFIYMASIASNEKFKPMNTKTLTIMTMLMTIMLTMNMMEDSTMEMNSNMEMMKNSLMENEELKSTSKFYNSNKMNITMMLILTLMLTMVSVTNISSTFEGPLKKTYV